MSPIGLGQNITSVPALGLGQNTTSANIMNSVSLSPSVFLDLLAAGPTVILGIVGDVLGLAARPGVLLGACGLFSRAVTDTLARGGLGVGLLTTISAGLVGVSAGALCGGGGLEALGRAVGGMLVVDGLAQLPGLLLLSGGGGGGAAASAFGLLAACVVFARRPVASGFAACHGES